MATIKQDEAAAEWGLPGLTSRDMATEDGLTLKLYEMGEGPLVVLIHGWPELAYSWRYQMPALSAAGYKVVAPDMRGYGQSDAPAEIEPYTIQKLTRDIVSIIDAYGAEDATIVGHDWGAIVSWHTNLLHPTRVNAHAALSVPYHGRPPKPMTEMLKDAYGEDFFYILYFQQDGVAEAEFDADPRGILERLYAEPGTPRGPKALEDKKLSAGGWIPRLGKPLEAQSWLSEDDMAYYVDAFTNSGFRGGINYYRNIANNWHSTPELDGAKIDTPTTFIAGEKDMVIRRASAEELRQSMEKTVTDLRGVTLIDDAGHWIQQERADEVNALLLDFLATLD